MRVGSESSSAHKVILHDIESLHESDLVSVSCWSLHLIHQEKQAALQGLSFEILPISPYSGLCLRVLVRMPSEFFL